MPNPAPSPMAVFQMPSTLLNSASQPKPLLNKPKPAPSLSLLNSASKPNALLALPETWLLNSANEPNAQLRLPVVLSRSALIPTAVLSWPVVLKNIAAVPTAVLSAPSLKNSVPAPNPLLKKASVLVNSENHPKGELKALSEFSRALNPSAVLLLTGKGVGSGLSGLPAPNASPKQASTEKIVVNIVKLLRFFISLIFLLLFWPSLIFPRRAVNPAPARQTRHHAISCPAINTYFRWDAFSQNAEAVSRRKIKTVKAFAAGANAFPIQVA